MKSIIKFKENKISRDGKTIPIYKKHYISDEEYKAAKEQVKKIIEDSLKPIEEVLTNENPGTSESSDPVAEPVVGNS